VTTGPAKVDLKVFETQIRDGQIWVRSTRAESAQRATPAARPQQGSAEPQGAPGRPAEGAAVKLNPDQSVSPDQTESFVI
jgi:hypothetical protein